ncbi:protease inhibitor I42 family protein [Paenibacillus sp. WLX2291]|uniref:protease inhibitor I42 family protein n=1 Tax=Paenibacillus sp. WLX2291 TaxID=3296934 RepID=UPI00398406D5
MNNKLNRKVTLWGTVCMAGMISLGTLGIQEIASAQITPALIANVSQQKSSIGDTWTFTADKDGTYTVKFVYVKYGKDKTEIAKKLVYKVKVAGTSTESKAPIALQTNTLNTVKKGELLTVILPEADKQGYVWVLKDADQSLHSEKQPDGPILFTGDGQENKQTIKTTPNKMFNITLEENPSTGYSWSYKASSNAISLVKEQSQPQNNSNENIVGAPNDKSWTFKAAKAGTYTLTFTSAQPWEKDTSKAETKTYTIVVEDNQTTDQVKTLQYTINVK